MPNYRLVWRDENGNMPRSKPIECLTVREAIGIAERQTGDYMEIEIWDGTQPIARCDNPNKFKEPAGGDPRGGRRLSIPC
jgi:hypothetical protein